MIIKSVALNNFRNYETLSLELGTNLNILYGDNAQGKTNVLEAIYVCGTTKSHKGSKDKELIRLGCEDSHIRMIVSKEGIDHKIDMHLKKSRSKGIAIDGVPIKRSVDIFGLVYIVFFSPEDLNMIKEGPGERRRFLDMELSQMNKLYLYHLTKYNKVLMQRNNLLKQISHEPGLADTLDVWDRQLIDNGRVLVNSREKFINSINEIIEPIHSRLTGNTEKIKLIYEPNVTEEDFEVKVKKNRDRDIYQKMTLTGPHRDDICFLINDIDIRKFGSQGQQRTAALSLKLSEIELVKSNIKDNPILLLDDVLSELDRKRQNYLMDSINDIQTIITCTGLEELVEKKKDVSRIFHVVKGNIN
jgi:DNA replication and repair protein RecF